MKSLVIVLTLLCSTVAQAQIRIPDDRHVLSHFGECSAEFLPTNFSLFLWNIKKGDGKREWARDFESFAPKSDLILLQEAMLDRFVPAIALRQKNFCWDFATSFIDGDPTGVMNGSPIIPLSIGFLRSPGREPITNTPKMALVAEFAIANSPETLMVANIHALNFVTDKTNRAHIAQVIDFLRSHQGPIIFAGDFNTWNTNRLKHLEDLTRPLGLRKLPLANDRRASQLDHIYARGLDVRNSTLHPNIDSSDHKPITAEFRLK